MEGATEDVNRGLRVERWVFDTHTDKKKACAENIPSRVVHHNSSATATSPIAT